MGRSFVPVCALVLALVTTAAQAQCPEGQDQLDHVHAFMADPFLTDPEWAPPPTDEAPECDGEACEHAEDEALRSFARTIEIDGTIGEIDHDALLRAGIELVLVHAGPGSAIDPAFRHHWDALASTDLFRGAIQELDRAADPVAQAEHLLMEVGTLGAGDLAPSLIVPDGADPEAVRAWTEIIATQTGREPFVHASSATRAVLEAAGVTALFGGTHDASTLGFCSGDLVALDLVRTTERGRIVGLARTDLRLGVVRGGTASLESLGGGMPWLDAPYAEPLPEGAGGGGVPLPLAWPVPGHDVYPRKGNGHHVCGREVSSTCAANRYDGDRRGHWHHYGNDMLNPIGTRVTAPARATVVSATYDCPTRGRCPSDAGNVVLLQHADGSRTRYLHLARPSDYPGSATVRGGRDPQTVTCGQEIGRVGLSGNASSGGAIPASHLHFEYKRGGVHVDPYGAPTESRSGGRCTCVPATRADWHWVDSCSGGTTESDDSRLTRGTVGTGAAGTTVRASGTFENSGTTTWSTRYVLVRTAGSFGPERVALTTPVSPSQSRTFTFDVTVPDVAPGATVTARYRLANAAGRAFGADFPVRFSRPREAPTTCASETLGRDVPANTCVQRGMGTSDGCSWLRCVAGRWTASTEADTACGERHPSATCNTPGSCVSTTLGRSVPDGTCVQRAPGMPGCEWFRCTAGAWTAQTAEQCLFEVAPGAPESTTYRHAMCTEWADPCASDGTTCDDCSARVGCGFCADDGSCRSDFLEGTCTDWRAAWFECVDCDAITDCGECATNGCGWCASNDSCMAARSGGGPLRPCEDWHYTDTIAWCEANER